MKILELNIMSPNDELVRNIQFKESGLTFIYGDIKRPDDRTSTINSLGKTLLLKMIDYLFGANNDSSIMKEAIHNYYLDAKIKYDDKLYDVKRIIGNSDSSIYINGEVKRLTEYKEFFGIKRQDYDKQVILTAESSLVSLRQSPTISDYETILGMLMLDQLLKNIKDIYITQDDLKRLKQNRKDLISTFENSLKKNNETIEQRIYLIDKKEEELRKEISIMADKIKTLEVSNDKESNITEYENINKIGR